MYEQIIKYRNALLFLFLLPVIYFPIFLHLGYMPVRMWDESITGASAVEMLHNHHYLVAYYNGSPDMSNCKPPLMIWCIVFLSKIFGFSELTLRLPSAIAAAALCVYLFWLLQKYFGNSLYGFITVVILVTSQGYIRNHVTRTGEYDSLLVLFSTISSLHLFLAIDSDNKKGLSNHLFLFFVFLTLAVLTKGIAPMMQAPGLFIYALFRRKIIPFLTTKGFYLGLAFFVFFGIGYYFLRESVNPGYLKAVWENEIGGRFGSDLDGHNGPLTLYLSEIITWQFVNYMFIFPVALVAGLTIAPSRIRQLVIFVACTGMFFLLTISLAQTKLPHYDAPLFPYLAIITATFFYLIYAGLQQLFGARLNKLLAGIAAFLFILGCFAKPYSDIISKVYFPKGDPWEEWFTVNCRYFQAAARKEVDANSYKLVFDVKHQFGEESVLKCYEENLRAKGLTPQIVRHDQLNTNDKVIVFNGWIKHLIEESYETETTGHLDFCDADVLYIKGPKIKT